MAEKSVSLCYKILSCIACNNNPCCKKPQKRNNKGLVTFDKRQYFPMCFVEQIGRSGSTERESQVDKKQLLKKSENAKKPVVVQGLDEDDENAFNQNNEEEEPEILARDRDGDDLHIGGQRANVNNLISR